MLRIRHGSAPTASVPHRLFDDDGGGGGDLSERSSRSLDQSSHHVRDLTGRLRTRVRAHRREARAGGARAEAHARTRAAPCALRRTLRAQVSHSVDSGSARSASELGVPPARAAFVAPAEPWR